LTERGTPRERRRSSRSAAGVNSSVSRPAASAGDAHVVAGLGLAERVEPPAHADPLAQLAQLGRVEQRVELG
jgi:hypothetical protein